MRRAVITIEWDGPDKPVREWITLRVDEMFGSMPDVCGDRLSWATSGIEFTSKVKPAKAKAPVAPSPQPQAASDG